MHPSLRILALVTTALLLAGGGAWAGCDGLLSDCCDLKAPEISEHCSKSPRVPAIGMDCGRDHTLAAAAGGLVNAKPLDPFQPASAPGSNTTLSQTARPGSAGTVPARAPSGGADLLTLYSTLRL